MKLNSFKDPSVKPNNDIVFSIIGDKSLQWLQLMSYLNDNYKDITEEWNYYNDGKSWLFRTQKKKKTVFWISVLIDTFQIAFWFVDRAELLIEQSNLSQKIKDEFKTAKKMGIMGRCIFFEVHDSNDFENAKILIDIKANLK